MQNERPKLLGEVGSSGQGRGSSGQSGQPTSGQNAEEALMQSARGLAMVNQPAGAEFGGRYYIEMIESSSVNAPMFHSVSLLMSFFSSSSSYEYDLTWVVLAFVHITRHYGSNFRDIKTGPRCGANERQIFLISKRNMRGFF